MDAQEVVDPDAHLYVNVDARILYLISKLRTEHGACTMRAVASVGHLGLTAVSSRIRKMVEKGVIQMTEMPGSIRLADDAAFNEEAVWRAPVAIQVPTQSPRPAWQEAILDRVIELSVSGDVEDESWVGELLGLVPKPPKVTDEEALEIAHQLELDNAVVEPAPVLDTLDEILRIEALGGSTEVPDLVDPSGQAYAPEIVAAKMAEAAGLADTPMTLAVDKPVKAAQRTASKTATKRPTKPRETKQRTPEEQQIINDRMAKVRQAQKEKREAASAGAR